MQGGWRNAFAEDLLVPVGIPIVRSFNESLPLYYYHRCANTPNCLSSRDTPKHTPFRDNGAGYECTHYCFPSAQQTWVFALYRTLALQFGGGVAKPTTPFLERAQH